MAKTKKEKGVSNETEEKKIKRQFGVPETLYYEMVDENTRIKRDGIRETTEQTMLNLMRDGLKHRKEQAKKKESA